MSKRLVNIMPMAGKGSRFKKVGIKIPKPLIDIKGKPMFLRSAKCMPKANLWIFITQKNFLKNKFFKKKINSNFKKNKIITVNKITKGQASSCYLAKKYLRKKDQILISSCDSFINFNLKDFNKKKKKYDVIIFTTRSNNIHLNNPNAYGWVKTKKNGEINVSCKKPLSSNLKKDRVVVGTFFFRELVFFSKSIKSLFNNRMKINNEYYLDMAIKESIKLGFRVGEVIVNKYISWGSLEELEKSKNQRIF